MRLILFGDWSVFCFISMHFRSCDFEAKTRPCAHGSTWTRHV